jgi:hypothetical protein
MFHTPLRTLRLSNSFPPVYGTPIVIPENCIVYRGYSTQYPVLSERPAYFGNIETAESYTKNPGEILGTFLTSRPLRLLDYRFLKVLLRQLFERVTKETRVAKQDSKVIQSVLLSFGLYSLQHQIELLNNFPKEYIDYNSGFQALIDTLKIPGGLLEQPGIRVAETTNDAVTMGFLKGFLERHFDGFVSPLLESAFHTEKNGILPPEIILFHPINSGMKHVNLMGKILPSISIVDILIHNHIFVALTVKDVEVEVFMKGGSSESSVNVIDTIEHAIQNKDKVITKQYNTGYSTGQKWFMNDIHIFHHIPPHPTIDPALFNLPVEGGLEIN